MKPEKRFERQVRQFLEDQGCWVLKTWSNGVQREGVPDLLVCCGGYFLGVEVKADTGKPSTLQLLNIEKIRAAYGLAVVLYPDQFEQFKHLVHLILSENSMVTAMQYDFDGKAKK